MPSPVSNAVGNDFGMVSPETKSALEELHAKDRDIDAMIEAMRPRQKGEEPKKERLSVDIIEAIRNFEPSRRNALSIASAILGLFFAAPVVVSLTQPYAPGGLVFIPNGTANATNVTNASDSSNSSAGNFVPFEAQHADVSMTALFGALAIFCILVVPAVLQLLRPRAATADVTMPLEVVATTPADTTQPMGNGQRAVGNLNRTGREEAESPLLSSGAATPNYGSREA